MKKRYNKNRFLFIIMPLVVSSVIFSLLFMSTTLNKQAQYIDFLENTKGDFIFFEENGTIVKSNAYEKNELFKNKYSLEDIHYLQVIDANISIENNWENYKLCIASSEFYQLFLNATLDKNQFMLPQGSVSLEFNSNYNLTFIIGGEINQTENLQLVYRFYSEKGFSVSTVLNYHFWVRNFESLLFLTDETFEEMFANTTKDQINILYLSIFDFDKSELMGYAPKKAASIVKENTLKLYLDLKRESPYAIETEHHSSLYKYIDPYYQYPLKVTIYGKNGPYKQVDSYIPVLTFTVMIFSLAVIIIMFVNYSKTFHFFQKEHYTYIILKGGTRKFVLLQLVRDYFFKSLPFSILASIFIQYILLYSILPETIFWTNFTLNLVYSAILCVFIIAMIQFYFLVKNYQLRLFEQEENSNFVRRLKKDLGTYFVYFIGIIAIGLFTESLFNMNQPQQPRVLVHALNALLIYMAIILFMFLFIRYYLPFSGAIIGKIVAHKLRYKKYIYSPISSTLRKNVAQIRVLVFFMIIVSVPLLSIDSMKSFQSETATINQFYDVTVKIKYEHFDYVNEFLKNMTNEKLDLYRSKLSQYRLTKENSEIKITKFSVNYFYLSPSDMVKLSHFESMNKNYHGEMYNSFPVDKLLESNSSVIIDQQFASLSRMKAGESYLIDFVVGTLLTKRSNVSIIDTVSFIPLFSWLTAHDHNGCDNMLITTGKEFVGGRSWISVYQHINLIEGISVEEFKEYIFSLNNLYQFNIEIIDFSSLSLFKYIEPYNTPVMIRINLILLLLTGLFVGTQIVIYSKQTLGELFTKMSLLYAKGLKIKQGISLSAFAITLMLFSLIFISFIVAIGITQLFLLGSQAPQYNLPIFVFIGNSVLIFLFVTFTSLFTLGLFTSFYHYIRMKKSITILSLSEQSKSQLMELLL